MTETSIAAAVRKLRMYAEEHDDDEIEVLLADYAACRAALTSGVADPAWETDETRTEWAVRTTGTGGLVAVGATVPEKYARQWAQSFPVQHPAEIASAEPVSRVVQHRATAWTAAPETGGPS